MVSNSNREAYLLLDVGGTFIKVGAATPHGALLPDMTCSIPIDSGGSRQQIEATFVETVGQSIARLRNMGLALAGIGVAMPGPFDYEAGIPLMRHKFAAVYGVSLRALIGLIPTVGTEIPIRFVHDVNAVLLGEMKYGNAVGCHNAAVVTLGTGLGFAYSRNAEVQLSATGSPATPIYNLPHDGKTLEDFASKRGFLSIYASLSGTADPALTVADLGRMAAAGDPLAQQTFARVGGILGDVLRPILERYEIECLLFGGQISRSFAFIRPELCKQLGDLPHLCRIDPVKHIGEAAFLGLCSRFIR